MRESVGNAYLLGIVTFFIGVIMLFFCASLNYTKAFKVKNRIVNIIEQNQGYTFGDSGTRQEIDAELEDMNYKRSSNHKCKEDGRFSTAAAKTEQGNTNYLYCVYEFDLGEKGKYYGVVTYMYFEIPLINVTLKFPVYGETKTMGEY